MGYSHPRAGQYLDVFPGYPRRKVRGDRARPEKPFTLGVPNRRDTLTFPLNLGEAYEDVRQNPGPVCHELVLLWALGEGYGEPLPSLPNPLPHEARRLRVDRVRRVHARPLTHPRRQVMAVIQHLLLNRVDRLLGAPELEREELGEDDPGKPGPGEMG